MINTEVDNLRYRIINRYVDCLRDIEVDNHLREQLNWSDNNKIIGQIAYSIHNIVDLSDEAFRPDHLMMSIIMKPLFCENCQNMLKIWKTTYYQNWSVCV